MITESRKYKFPRERYWEALDQASAPASYRNWLAYVEKRRYHGTIEYALYSDVSILGSVSGKIGPYQIIRPQMSASENESSQIRLVLSVDRHLYPSTLFGVGSRLITVPSELCDSTVLYGNKPCKKKRNKRYSKNDVIENVDHGGIVNEIAALLSLCLGVAINAGGEIREFRPGGHPRGLPCSFDIQNIPVRPIRGNRRMIPHEPASPVLDQNLHLLPTYPLLSPVFAAALIRASRIYQRALWYSDVMPDLSWLLLVQAVETAAKQCKLQSGGDQPGGDAEWRQELDTYLREIRLSQLQIDHIGDIIPKKLYATRNFVSFMLERLATAPSVRPPSFFQMPWDQENWRRLLNNIYEFRSEALHEGRPFPPELCSLPDVSDGGIYAEYSPPYDAPPRCVHLHVFAYVVRHALLLWWAQSLDSQKETIDN